MPFTLDDIRGENSAAKVPWNDKELSITYNRNAISMREWRRLRRQIDASDPDNPDADWIVLALTALLVKWDLLDARGKTVPITEEALDNLPPLFLLKILETIWGELVPNGTAPAASSGSFS